MSCRGSPQQFVGRLGAYCGLVFCSARQVFRSNLAHQETGDQCSILSPLSTGSRSRLSRPIDLESDRVCSSGQTIKRGKIGILKCYCDVPVTLIFPGRLNEDRVVCDDFLFLVFFPCWFEVLAEVCPKVCSLAGFYLHQRNAPNGAFGEVFLSFHLVTQEAETEHEREQNHFSHDKVFLSLKRSEEQTASIST